MTAWIRIPTAIVSILNAMTDKTDEWALKFWIGVLKLISDEYEINEVE